MTGSPYELKQTIYVNAGYARLLDLINGYLARLPWQVGEDREDSLRDVQAHRRWEEGRNEGRAALVVYEGRTHVSMVGSGLSIRVLHVRRFVQEGTQNVSSIPTAVRRRLNDIPNAVEIDSHRFWYQDGNQLAFNLVRYLADQGCQSCMASPSGELSYVRRNPLLSAHARLEPMTDSSPTSSETGSRPRDARALLQGTLSDVWSELSETVKKFLVTGVFLYEQFESVRHAPLDMSSVSVQFSKAVETIIAERVLLPFRAWYGAHRRWSGTFLERDRRDHRLRRFASFIDGPRRRTPDLGVFLFVLNLVRENRMRRSPSLRAFREFARRVDDPDFLLWNADLTNVLREITTRYRKGAAHTEPQSFEMTHDFMRLLFGGAPPDRSADTNCFLQRLVQATSISGGS